MAHEPEVEREREGGRDDAQAGQRGPAFGAQAGVVRGTGRRHDQCRGDGRTDGYFRHAEVDRLRQDMGLIQEVLYKEKETITEDEVRRGICPACPYPEASLDLTESPGGKKTRSTKESQHE